MKIQTLKYPFTVAGIAQWQQWLDGLSPVQRNEEANRVEQGLYAFVPRRFTLGAEQVAFLDSLPASLCALWTTQVAYAIREEIPITLVKPENKDGTQAMGIKFIESEGTSGNAPDRPAKKRIAHCGFVDGWDGTWCLTVEGNVDNAVVRKRRPIKTIRTVSRWMPNNP